MDFNDADAYTRAYTKDRSLAIVPVPMAADLFGITSAGIVARVRNGALQEIRVAGTRYVTMESVIDSVSRTDRDVDIVKAFLEQQARSGVESIEYTPVMGLLGLSSKISADRTKIGWILGAVSRRSFQEKGVLLSVLVHRKNTRMPSEKGFFGLVDNLIEDWDDRHGDRESFVEAEIKRVLKKYRKRDK